MAYELKIWLRNLIRANRGPVASRLHVIFDDYGNFQLRRKQEDDEKDRGYMLDCTFEHVEQIEFGHRLEITSFSLGKLREQIKEQGDDLDYQDYESWEKRCKNRWAFEEHDN